YDADPSGEGLPHRAAIRDPEQPGPLFLGEVPGELDRPRELVDADIFHRAVLAVLLVYAVVREPDRDALQRPSTPVRVHPDRHRGARPEGRREIVVRGRTGVGAAQGSRLVDDQGVAARGDLRPEPATPYP